jgi:hypothetical protein
MDYDIYRDEMATKYPAYGHALWVPGPGRFHPAVEVGDVGFIREGQFHRLFNALLPKDHPSHKDFGVPEYHVPLELKVPKHIHISERKLSPNNFRSRGVRLVSDQEGIYARG